MNEKIRSWLAKAPTWLFSGYAIAAAFSTYFCMYAFRKPFSVAKFEGQTLWDTGLELKVAFIISQIIGYALSKVIGIKFVSEVKAENRFVALLCMIGFAEAALLAFAVLPPPLKIVAIFFNGLPLGAVWGLVFGFLEGRKTSELLGAGLSCSYIVASGAVKSAGRYLLTMGVSESWMPFLTGVCFAPFFLLAAWGLSLLPRPSEDDVESRTLREPMYAKDRAAFFKMFALGLSLLTILYFFLTAYRDYRDNFAPEIWEELGYACDISANNADMINNGEIPQEMKNKLAELNYNISSSMFVKSGKKPGLWKIYEKIDDTEEEMYSVKLKGDFIKIYQSEGSAIYTLSELPIAFSVMLVLALLYLVKDNHKGVSLTHFIMLFGTLMIGVGTFCFDREWISGTAWMVLVGLGLYLAYVPYGCVLFDRLIAAMGVVATSVFMIYVTDSVGYIGSIGINLYKNFGQSEMSKLEFFRYFSYFTSIFCSVCFIGSWIYFASVKKT